MSNYFKSSFASNTDDDEISEILNWISLIKAKNELKIEKTCFSCLQYWEKDGTTGNLNHRSKKFFSLIGINVQTNWGGINNWSQPVIKQSEIGILGIITKKIEGQLYYLMQAKIEPGNINYVQISPTLQATKSNYTQVHRGKKPPYLDYFRCNKTTPIVDQLQSEQGARFLKKRNRNILIHSEEPIEVLDNYKWLTLKQIHLLLLIDNVVNMDTRTVISSLLFHDEEVAPEKQNSKFTIHELIHWITVLKTKYELIVEEIPLKKITEWEFTDECIFHKEEKYFEVIPVDISIEGREVTRWMQPMIRAKQKGICAFIIKRINEVFHFLVQGKVECGNFDIVEIAPTVQCLTGNYEDEKSINLPYLNYILNVSSNQILYDTMQSEEGGRFYREENRNMIIQAEDKFSLETPDNFTWMTLRQIKKFIMFNNYVNIQARSLVSILISKELDFD